MSWASVLGNASFMMGDLLGKPTPPSRAVPLAPVMRWVAPAIVELESHLTLPPTWRASCRGVKTAASMLFKLVSEYGSLVAQVDSRTQES